MEFGSFCIKPACVLSQKLYAKRCAQAGLHRKPTTKTAYLLFMKRWLKLIQYMSCFGLCAQKTVNKNVNKRNGMYCELLLEFCFFTRLYG